MPEQIYAELGKLAAGLVSVLAALAMGHSILRASGLSAPIHWRFPLGLLLGIAVAETCLTAALYLGGGICTIQNVSGCLLAAAAICLVRELFLYRPRPLISMSGREWWLAGVIIAALALNLIIALAPSTKIDELHYHMLVPKRVIQDNGLRPYQQPYEAAIFPQLAFQYSLSALFAFGVPEAGNVISWGIGGALIFLIIGLLTELTSERETGLLFGAVAAVGLYPAVWYVTSGPHALGDLATTAAFCLFLLPEKAVGWAPPKTRLVLICVAACLAASTKITLIPISVSLCLLAWRGTARRIGWKTPTLVVVGVWTIMFAPSLVWASIRSGSPFGLATATLFHSSFFNQETLAVLALAKQARPTGLVPLLRLLMPSLSIGFLLALGVVAWNASKQSSFRVVLVFVTAQTILIALFLAHDFRFLGGLQFVVLIMGAWALSLSPKGQRWFMRCHLLGVVLCLPWLAIQAYYGAMFFPVDFGRESREAFLNRYVAFSADFQQLNRILPANAVLYVKNSPKNPAYYAPRPVIFTLSDAVPGQHIFRFRVGEAEPETALTCNGKVYANAHAVSYAFRTSEPLYDELTVEDCF